MYNLRWIFLVACLGCVAIVTLNGRWEGRLTLRNYTWIVDLDRAPVWAPPPDPPYAKFQKVFKESDDFPAGGTPGLTIHRVLKLDSLAVDLLLYLWPVTFFSGLLYLALRGERRDLILHCGLSAGIGLTAGAVVCIGLWLLLGGWGPPLPDCCGSLALFVGIFVGIRSFKGDRKPACPV
jgi:hypothetical protein